MHVESFLVACLDEGSSPSVSTKKPPNSELFLNLGVFLFGGEGGRGRFEVQGSRFEVQGSRLNA